MQAYVEGDAAAFERLFESLAPSVLGFFERSLGGAAVAEDLMQTTFLKLHGARRRWHRGDRLRPWVFTIAAHVRADWLRAQARTRAEPLDDDVAAATSAVDPAAADPAAGAADRERTDRVRAALDALPEAQRVVVQLHRFEGLGFAEIGKVLGISEGAAKLRAFRAYRALRGRLGDLVAEPSR